VRKRASLFLIIGAIVALHALFPIASLAADGGEPGESTKQAGEDRWVPSLAITSGVLVQKQDGLADSVLFEDMSPTSIPLRGFLDGDDLVVAPFVGGALEVMSPALPIRTRPRLFISGEIIPTFATSRDLAVEGDPGCVRGSEPGLPCARDDDGTGPRSFPQTSANGTGTKTTAKIDTLVYGANLGVAFPLQVGKRQLRIKPSFGWINYEVEASGLVVDAACDPSIQCTTTTDNAPNPSPPPPTIPVVTPGFLRETILRGNDSQRFNGIGPGLDIEMDTGQYGPLGVSLFMGARAYAIVDDRTISFSGSKSFDDQLGMDTAVARFEVKVDSWIYRAHVGIRFHWLGNQ
jgi:hypothetical protein